MSIQDKLVLVQDSLDRFEDFYDMASCDMCCGGGNEHYETLSGLFARLSEGESIPIEDIRPWLFSPS